MNAFESAKRNFGSSDDDRAIEIGPLDMEVPCSPNYDDDEQAVKLSKYNNLTPSTVMHANGSHRNDMASLFDPPMRELTALVDSQANLAKQKGKRIDVSQSQTSHATETYLFCLAAIHPCGRLWRFGIPE
jgi:hypothetical protein